MDINLITESSIKNIFQNRVSRPEGVYTYSSVMILLFPIENTYNILFCQRAFSLSSQPGDVCFPGGKSEKNETPLETALRETQEELNITSNDIEVFGKTDYIVATSGKIITPFIATVKNIKISDIVFNKSEVEKIFTVPLSFFYETRPIESHISYEPVMEKNFPYDLIVGGKNYNWSIFNNKQIFYKYEDNVIWGLTARIVNNLCEILKNIK